MMGERLVKKLYRLKQLEDILLDAHPKGLRNIDLAERIGVSRSEIPEYIADLGAIGVDVYDTEDEKHAIDPKTHKVTVRLNLDQRLALLLAVRLLTTRTDKRNSHAAEALRELARAFGPRATLIAQHVRRSAEVIEGPHRRDSSLFMACLEKLTGAWAGQLQVRLAYESEEGHSVTHTFSTYFIEPYALGNTLYVIGRSNLSNKLLTLKVERIRGVEILTTKYEIPEDFDPTEFLRDAWGIWRTDKPVQTVILRFASSVAYRVRETQWHYAETITPQDNGDLIWQAAIAEPREMLPWIRGWGADCEVLEPKWLRSELVREAGELAMLYQVMETKDQFVAHFRKKDKKFQYLSEHLNEVSDFAGQFANKIGLRESGEILGLLHDLGKGSKEFQNYIKSANDLIDPDSDDYVDAKAKKGKVDHSSAGAQVIYKHLWSKGAEARLVAQVLSLAIASHHSGLIDCLLPSGEDNFTRRMEKLEESAHTNEAFANLGEQEKLTVNALLADEGLAKSLFEKLKSLKEENETQETYKFKCGLLIRFLLSCLLDADRINTADFEFPNNKRLRNNNAYPSWESLIERLDGRIHEFENKPDRNDVDDLRSQVSQSCLDFSTKPKGIYQLTVPTGGGKTLASLRFALNHAAYHGKSNNKIDRVFYVIPYTSIIDQNAETVREILEDKDRNENYLNKVVLEHHSNLTPDEETHRQSLLSENWDAPVVFTTQVQFLETLFGSGTRSARRMHQLANSVIIFDEIQTIPIRCIHMFNIAIRFLVHTCGATVVLCTATQPLLDNIDPVQYALKIQPEQKIIPYEKELFMKLKRVEVFDRRKVGGWSEEDVAELADQELREKGSVLIVVNTRKSAYSLFQAVAQKSNVTTHHLSTNMCPAHRLKVLGEIKDKLAKQEPVICVSTQLIEAGVDIDFGSVIRYLAGMDSIAQAAGRCNRNGVRKNLGNVWVVNPSEENTEKLKDIQIGIEKAKRILDEFKDNPETFENDKIGLETMEAYYRYYFYERKGEMCYQVRTNSPVGREDNLFSLLSSNTLSVQEHERIAEVSSDIPFKQSFQTASKTFRAIDSTTQGVVVPFGEGKELINDLCGAYDLEKQFDLIKKAQRYSVNLFPYQFKKMADSNAIREVQKGAGIYYLDDQYYSEKFGWSDDPVNGMKLLTV